MTTTPNLYQPMITARSRRLRTTGLLLLVAIMGMALYGYGVLMPSLRTLPHITRPAQGIRAHSGSVSTSTAASIAPGIPSTAPVLSEHEKKAALAKVIFVYGYWAFCGLLILALILVVWLDFRELSSRYAEQRRSLFTETVTSLYTDKRQD